MTYTNSKKKFLIPVEISELLNSRFNIIDSLEFKQFDMDWKNLRTILTNTKKSEFSANDRYIIVHQDTDIYIHEMQVGVNLRNFFQIAAEIDIPFYTFIFWTNHFGLQQELDILCRNRHPKDRPMLIESFAATAHIGDYYTEFAVDQDQIEYHALSMIGAGRSHRYALYNEIKNIGPDKLALSIGNGA